MKELKFKEKILSIILIILFVVLVQKVNATNINGTEYASNLVDNDNIVLTGNTVLFMNADLTLKSISGDYNLEIQGSNTLTINNPNGTGISVKSFNSMAPLHITARDDAKLTIYDTDMTVTGLYPLTGDISGNESLSIVAANVEISAKGSAAVDDFNGGITLFDSEITSPDGAYVSYATILASNGNYARNVIIKRQITLWNDYDNARTLEEYAANGKTLNTKISGRTFSKNDTWSTLCLPFDVEDLTGTPLEGATVMELNTSSRNGFDVSSGILYLSFKTVSAIESGKPYIVKWTDGEEVVNPVFEDVTILNNEPIAHTSETFDLETVTMVGIYAPFDIEANDQSIMLMGTDNNFFCPAEDTTLNGFHAYFEIPSLQGVEDIGVKGYVIDFDGVTVGIDDITVENLQYPDGWYTITGIKLSEQPTTPGIYIHNGKKIIIK